MTVIIIILKQNKDKCEVTTQLEREKEKPMWEVEQGIKGRVGTKKETRSRVNSVPIIRYRLRSLSPLLSPLWVNEHQRLVFMSSDTVMEQLTDCLPQVIGLLLASRKRQRTVLFYDFMLPVLYCTCMTSWSAEGARFEICHLCIQLADHSRLILMLVFFSFLL